MKSTTKRRTFAAFRRAHEGIDIPDGRPVRCKTKARKTLDVRKPLYLAYCDTLKRKERKKRIPKVKVERKQRTLWRVQQEIVRLRFNSENAKTHYKMHEVALKVGVKICVARYVCKKYVLNNYQLPPPYKRESFKKLKPI